MTTLGSSSAAVAGRSTLRPERYYRMHGWWILGIALHHSYLLLIKILLLLVTGGNVSRFFGETLGHESRVPGTIAILVLFALRNCTKKDEGVRSSNKRNIACGSRSTARRWTIASITLCFRINHKAARQLRSHHQRSTTS
jgi:hypothetical protein